MNGTTGGRGWRGHLLAALVVCLVPLVSAGARAETPTPTPTATAPSPASSPTEAPVTTRPVAVCEPGATFEHQLVACRAEGLAPGGAVVLRVRLDGAVEPRDEWVGGVRATSDGRVEVDVAIPCDLDGTATTEVSGPLPDAGRFRHRATVELAGACPTSPMVPREAWAGLAAALVGLSSLVVVTGAWRHRTRRRRGVRGPSGRRRPDRRGRGRRRPPRRRRRRPSRARRRRRRSR